jgi:hypothetical protein
MQIVAILLFNKFHLFDTARLVVPQIKSQPYFKNK